ncbi:cupin domain-containing protein [Roseateles sp.]|uniref:cupin domain-containing protein n=1 Tax=Roseateles sp. TaxID=1971397 RepID=UPI003BA9FADE
MPTADELRALLIRNVNDGPLDRFERPPRYDTQMLPLSDGTAARKLGAGFDIVAPGKQSCPYHLHHGQEEMFVVLKGEGTLRVAGELLPIREGDVVFIPAGPAYPHHILNTSDAPLHYLSISTKEWPDVCEYPDSGKVSAIPGPGGWRLRQRLENTLDYWDGEP